MTVAKEGQHGGVSLRNLYKGLKRPVGYEYIGGAINIKYHIPNTVNEVIDFGWRYTP